MQKLACSASKGITIREHRSSACAGGVSLCAERHLALRLTGAAQWSQRLSVCATSREHTSNPYSAIEFEHTCLKTAIMGSVESQFTGGFANVTECSWVRSAERR